MILQISSGMGPVECRAAVGGIFRALEKEFPDIEMITGVKGEVEGAYSSIIFTSEQDLSVLEGTMQWVCKSGYRPGHKRKNWFVDVSIIEEPDEVDGCVPLKNQKLVTDLLRNERYHYVELTHKQKILDKMMLLGEAINSQRVIEFDYKGVQGHADKHRSVEPYAIMFSDFYFYLVGRIRNIDSKTAFVNPNDAYPTIYRIDRLKSIKVTEEHFSMPYKNKFEEGEYRKRIQFMYGGKLRRVKFEYSGYAVEAVLDRLPTARIVSEDGGKYIVEAEVFGDGIDIWLRGQGDVIRILS